MKINTLLASLLFCCTGMTEAATYTDLSTSQCDETNHVIYDGKGGFSVDSTADTNVKISFNLNALHSFVNSNDYRSGNPMMLWETNAVAYGLADITDMSKATGEREPELCFYWAGKVWQPKQKISYSTIQQYAANGIVTLKMTNSQKNGVHIYAVASDGSEHELLATTGLKSSKIKSTVGYKVNLNYATAFTIDTSSALNTSGYTPPQDYTAPFESTKTGGKTLKRVMFMGDSITHGVNDQTWRWQLFKILIDNDIEAEIVGPRDGYTPNYTNMTTTDAGDSYCGKVFPNVHLAQSSGRTHNIISGSNTGMTGVNYGGHSTKSSADAYNCDTWCCMIGTNDLLSDKGYTAEEFATKMQNMLGGKVSIKGGKYSWKPGKDWGNIGQIAKDVLREDSDVLYVMAVPCWGFHGNNNEADRHLAVQQFNELLKQHTAQYAKKHGKKLVFVDVNQGLEDPTIDVPFSWPDSMSNKPGRDGLHPNEQGSLIIAANLAKAMGISGRTVGLQRKAAGQDWNKATAGTAKKKSGKKRAAMAALKPGLNTTKAEGEISFEKGFTAEFSAVTGNGEKSGWQKHQQALSICVSDGTNGSTLNISESSILWGDKVLYSPTGKTAKAPIRLVWHPGNKAHNIPQGFYVWVGDTLVGQGLPATESSPNGITISTHGINAAISPIQWVNEAFAPASNQ